MTLLTPADPRADGADTGSTPTAEAPRRRLRTIALPTAVAVLAAGGALAYGATGKDVTLVVDGEPTSVATRADEVDEVLAQAGYEVGEHDILAPGPDAPVADGAQIVLRRARPVTMEVDGQERTVWVTATDVDEALDQVGIADERAFVSADRSRSIGLDGLDLEVRLPKTVRVVDGANPPVQVVTTARDLGALVWELGLPVSPDDRLSAGLETAPVDGQEFVITRVEHGTKQEVQAIPPETVTRDDASLYRGETKVADAGRAGERVKTVAYRKENGVVVETAPVSETVTREPSAKVVLRGTKPRPAPVRAAAAAPSSSGSSSGGASPSGAWAKVAQCESGGNPRATNPSGKYRGMYQFSRQTWASVGGSGDPAAASVAEQTKRAQMLYERSGRGQWPKCGRFLPGS